MLLTDVPSVNYFQRGCSQQGNIPSRCFSLRNPSPVSDPGLPDDETIQMFQQEVRLLRLQAGGLTLVTEVGRSVRSIVFNDWLMYDCVLLH